MKNYLTIRENIKLIRVLLDVDTLHLKPVTEKALQRGLGKVRQNNSPF